MDGTARATATETPLSAINHGQSGSVRPLRDTHEKDEAERRRRKEDRKRERTNRAFLCCAKYSRLQGKWVSLCWSVGLRDAALSVVSVYCFTYENTRTQISLGIVLCKL